MATKEKKRFKKVRLHKVAKELNLTIGTIVDHLKDNGKDASLTGKGINAAIADEEAYLDLLEHFADDMHTRARVRELRAEREAELEAIQLERQAAEEAAEEAARAKLAEALAAEEEASAAAAEQEAAVKPAAEEAAAEDEAPPIAADGQDGAVPAPDEAPPEAPPEAAEPPPEVAAEVPEPADAEDAQPPGAKGDAADAADAEQAADEPPPETPAADAEPAQDAGEDGDVISAARYKLQGTKVLGTIDLNKVEEKKPAPEKRKRKRKRKRKTPVVPATTPVAVSDKSGARPSRRKSRKRKSQPEKPEVGQKVQETLQGLDKGPARVRQRRRRARRQQRAEERRTESEVRAEQEKHIRVTEFVSTGELAGLMGIPVTDIIGMLFGAGMMVSINQRLDADTISYVADDFGFEVEFITEFGTEDIEIEEDDPEDLTGRAPVVTVMGHVDHGKTSLLDYVRNANVAVGESGGITQHIGAYQVELPGDREVTFLDTPGHEAFTAMRARGAKVTDVVILVVAADDAVMPQTVEAINHARAAEVSIIVAINKCDLPDANAPRVMQQLSDHGVLVEQYGGTVQCQEVSAKTGEGVSELLEKVLLEADLLELKSNPDRRALGIVIESRLDRGRGNVATILVQNGTLRVGDPFVAGIYGGRVRAMFDEWDQRIHEAGPSEPALVLGLPGQPNVGDQLFGVEDESEARDISQRRQQIWREQRMRQYKHVRLEDVGRRMALGDLSELNLIIKADVGGSVEAISDSLQKLSTDEVAVNIIHSGVGAINDSDVMLASASDAVIIGFQVRPSAGARTAAEREEIDIRTYSIIYDALEDVRDALEGLLSPEETEKVTAVVDVRELFRVPKVGVIAGSYVVEGKIRRNDRVRVVREGVVIYESRVSSLKRFKEDAREVASGYECGIGIGNFNDLKVGDQVEAYEIVELKRTLDV